MTLEEYLQQEEQRDSRALARAHAEEMQRIRELEAAMQKQGALTELPTK